MINRQLRRHADAAVPQPGVDGAAALIERHRLPRFVAERGHRHRMQLLARDGFGDAGQVQFFLEQFAQRRTVEQRHRHLSTETEQAVADEAAGLMDHARPVAAQHAVAAKALPELGQAFDGGAKVRGATGQADRIDRPGRGADDHRKRIVRADRQQLGNRRQHPDLISRPSPAAGKNQTCNRFSRTHRNTPRCLSDRLINDAWDKASAHPAGDS